MFFNGVCLISFRFISLSLSLIFRTRLHAPQLSHSAFIPLPNALRSVRLRLSTLAFYRSSPVSSCHSSFPNSLLRGVTQLETVVGSAGEEEEETKRKKRRKERKREGGRKGRCGKPRTRPQKSPLVDLKFPKDTEKITRLAALSGGGWPVTALREREAGREGRRERQRQAREGWMGTDAARRCKV